jgi:hypothetical protein
VVLGMAVVTAGWPVAVDERDSIVNGAPTSPITQAYQHGDRWQAALLDFGANQRSITCAGSCRGPERSLR